MLRKPNTIQPARGIPAVDVPAGHVPRSAHGLPEPPIDEPEAPAIDHPPRPEPDVPVSDAPIDEPERPRDPGRLR